MRAASSVLVAAILAPLTSLAPFISAPQFKTGTETVMIYATVKDGSGRLVPDLTRDDFRVIDNGKPTAITTFSSEIQPLTVALLLDMSGSMTARLLRVRESTLHFVDALLPADRVRIGTFGDEIAISPLLTGDKPTLSRVVREELWPGGGTPLWNAIYAAMDSLADESGRRVILLLSDGMDSEPLPGRKGTFKEVRKRATQEGFMLYTIGMEGLIASVDLKPDTVKLIDDTGGGHFVVKDDEDLALTFARVAEELRRQYLIGFSPQVLDGAEHSISVELVQPGMQARHRQSYLAIKQ
jgi:Ca-activated chloride channel homolog